MATPHRSAFTISSALCVLACVAALGCNAKKKACEHARDALVEMTRADVQRALEQAPEEVKADAKKLGDKQVASLDEHFVGTCLEAPDDTLACIERVDELIEASNVHRAKIDDCFGAEVEPETIDACLDEARNELKEKTGDCEEAFEVLLREVDERAKEGKAGG